MAPIDVYGGGVDFTLGLHRVTSRPGLQGICEAQGDRAKNSANMGKDASEAPFASQILGDTAHGFFEMQEVRSIFKSQYSAQSGQCIN